MTRNALSDLRHAINLLLANGDLTGTAICSSIPDYYNWQGTEAAEMIYLSFRELGYAEEQAGQFSEAIAAYQKAAAFETISMADLETWAESSFSVGLAARAWVEFDRLIAIEPSR